MYISIQPNNPVKYGSEVNAYVNYLTKENTLAKEQLAKLEGGRVVNYLTKEDDLTKEQLVKLEKKTPKEELDRYRTMLNAPERLQGERELFFNSNSQQINAEEVAAKINSNKLGLKSNETHFYNLTIAPSGPELEHLQGIAKWQAIDMGQAENLELREQLLRGMLKEHAAKVMENYAQSFYRDRVVGSNDIVWYGKVEKDRYWKHDSAEVVHNTQTNKKIKVLQKQEGKEKEIEKLREGLKRDEGCIVYSNMPKSGLNHHVHIIVSRKDYEQKRSLSPLSKMKQSPNHQINGKMCKAGFNRSNFIKANESSFDQTFQYSRSFRTSYEAMNARRKLELCNRKLAEMKLEGKDAKLPEREKRLAQRKANYDLQLNTYNEKRGIAYNSFYSTIEGELKRAELAVLKKEIQELTSKAEKEAVLHGKDPKELNNPELDKLKQLYKDKEVAFEQARSDYNYHKGYDCKGVKPKRLGRYMLRTNSFSQTMSKRGAQMVARSAMSAIGLNMPAINIAMKLMQMGENKKSQKNSQFKAVEMLTTLVPGLKAVKLATKVIGKIDQLSPEKEI